MIEKHGNKEFSYPFRYIYFNSEKRYSINFNHIESTREYNGPFEDKYSTTNLTQKGNYNLQGMNNEIKNSPSPRDSNTFIKIEALVIDHLSNLGVDCAQYEVVEIFCM